MIFKYGMNATAESRAVKRTMYMRHYSEKALSEVWGKEAEGKGKGSITIRIVTLVNRLRCVVCRNVAMISL
jgi:hypothetical protein